MGETLAPTTLDISTSNQPSKSDTEPSIKSSKKKITLTKGTKKPPK